MTYWCAPSSKGNPFYTAKLTWKFTSISAVSHGAFPPGCLMTVLHTLLCKWTRVCVSEPAAPHVHRSPVPVTACNADQKVKLLMTTAGQVSHHMLLLTSSYSTVNDYKFMDCCQFIDCLLTNRIMTSNDYWNGRLTHGVSISAASSVLTVHDCHIWEQTNVTIHSVSLCGKGVGSLQLRHNRRTNHIHTCK